jgi:hypothetical protein
MERRLCAGSTTDMKQRNKTLLFADEEVIIEDRKLYTDYKM